MIAVKDIGIISAAVLQHPEAVDGGSVEVAGDEHTGEQIATAIGERMGKPTRYVHLPLEALGDDEDRRALFRWFAEPPAYRADFETTRSLNPDTATLEQWLTDRR